MIIFLLFTARDLAILGVQEPTDVDADPFGDGPIVDTGYFSSYPSLDDFYKRLQGKTHKQNTLTSITNNTQQ